MDVEVDVEVEGSIRGRSVRGMAQPNPDNYVVGQTCRETGGIWVWPRNKLSICGCHHVHGPE